jgi:hypothetical protein
VTCYDVFNGDADGLCALRQLRLHAPRDAVLVTGVKRDIRLLERVPARAGDQLVVLDVALEANRGALERVLTAGAACTWFDHHFPGPIPSHPALDLHIRCAPDTCTSLLVDEHLGGRWRRWAVAAAFGDGLPGPAAAAAATLVLRDEDIGILSQVGQVLNYNAYGESVADLHFAPDALYRTLERYEDPLDFARSDPAFARLLAGWREDMARAASAPAALDTDTHLMVLLPDAAWARRVSGPWASELAGRAPARAVAVLVPAQGGYVVSIRAPASHPRGADALAREFPSGGGRSGAAGINALPSGELERFAARFAASFVPG